MNHHCIAYTKGKFKTSFGCASYQLQRSTLPNIVVRWLYGSLSTLMLCTLIKSFLGRVLYKSSQKSVDICSLKEYALKNGKKGQVISNFFVKEKLEKKLIENYLSVICITHTHVAFSVVYCNCVPFI